MDRKPKFHSDLSFWTFIGLESGEFACILNIYAVAVFFVYYGFYLADV
jgi:hypothetical protein